MKEKSVLAKAFSVNNEGESDKPKQDIRTPIDLFTAIDRQFNFDLDPCDSEEKEYWLGIKSYNLKRNEDGLKLKWFGNVFVNPPWNNILPWIKKAEYELKNRNCRFVVFLIPSRTETRWFHHILNSEYLMNHTFLKSRVHFDEQKGAYVTGISIFTLWRNLF